MGIYSEYFMSYHLIQVQTTIKVTNQVNIKNEKDKPCTQNKKKEKKKFVTQRLISESFPLEIFRKIFRAKFTSFIQTRTDYYYW